jgi:hypothetical protein
LGRGPKRKRTTTSHQIAAQQEVEESRVPTTIVVEQPSISNGRNSPPLLTWLSLSISIGEGCSMGMEIGQPQQKQCSLEMLRLVSFRNAWCGFQSIGFHVEKTLVF